MRKADGNENFYPVTPVTLLVYYPLILNISKSVHILVHNSSEKVAEVDAYDARDELERFVLVHSIEPVHAWIINGYIINNKR